MNRPYRKRHGDVFDALARLRPPLILTLLLMLTGTMGYMVIDGYPFLDAWYMTIISVATVGFGEVHPLSSGGRIFTVFLIMGGFAVFTYSVGVFVEVVARRDLFGLMRIQRMENRIKGLVDHYIIVGYTSIAQELALVFRRRGIPFVVVESEGRGLAEVRQDRVEYFIEASYYDNEAYLRAGVKSARGIITTFKNDADNITVVVTGRLFEEQFGRDLFIVSTCSDAQYKARLEKVGADYVISPDSLIGHRISALAVRPPTDSHVSILEQVAFGEYTEMDIREVHVTADHSIAGQRINETDLRQKTGAYIVALKHGHKGVKINPGPEERIRAGDSMMVIGTRQQLARMEVYLVDNSIGNGGASSRKAAEVAATTAGAGKGES